MPGLAPQVRSPLGTRGPPFSFPDDPAPKVPPQCQAHLGLRQLSLEQLQSLRVLPLAVLKGLKLLLQLPLKHMHVSTGEQSSLGLQSPALLSMKGIILTQPFTPTPLSHYTPVTIKSCTVCFLDSYRIISIFHLDFW
jgi:hypothetical protein